MMKLSKPFARSSFGMTCVGLLMLTTSVSSHANDNDRITQLEKQVQELKLRLSNLEAQRSTSDTQTPQKAATSQSEATRPVAASKPAPAAPKTEATVLAKWRGLERGLSTDDVRGVLGAPLKTQTTSAFTYWDYPNQGSVTFHQGRLSGWTEPN